MKQAILAYWFIGLKRRNKAFILISTDVFFVLFALWAAFSLRWGELYIPKGDEWYLFAVAMNTEQQFPYKPPRKAPPHRPLLTNTIPLLPRTLKT